jgi:hypothetical protein
MWMQLDDFQKCSVRAAPLHQLLRQALQQQRLRLIMQLVCAAELAAVLWAVAPVLLGGRHDGGDVTHVAGSSCVMPRVHACQHSGQVHGLLRAAAAAAGG